VGGTSSSLAEIILAMLYSPESHEPLDVRPWDRDVALTAIREIAADCEASFDSLHWPMHPRDDAGDGPFTTVYLGSAGVIYALDLLARRGLVDSTRDHVPALERAVEVYRAKPEFEEWAHPPSMWMGETGILLTLHRLVPSAEIADRMAELVAANVHDPHREFMWGSPGTMLAARALDRLDLWQESGRVLRDAWEDSGLWTQDLYGARRQFVGPAHGFAGCVAALAHEPNEDLHRRASETFKRLAVEEDGLANWPVLADAQLVGRDGTIRTQWCHGAPGMVACLAEIAPGDDEHERLLVAGGELTWRAGPLAKGANLCHGTAGNGLAFLKLFRRTGDELWLERARAFAMHAGAQVERERRDLGRGHYTLWTGDPGTALYLALCIDGSASLPGFDDNDFV
jgi:Lanthionine synthetase C-like protein